MSAKIVSVKPSVVSLVVTLEIAGKLTTLDIPLPEPLAPNDSEQDRAYRAVDYTIDALEQLSERLKHIDTAKKREY